MSRISREVKKTMSDSTSKFSKTVNFMNGTSYKLNPLDTLKLIASSSIFGEPSYYRNNVKDDTVTIYKSCFSPYEVLKLTKGKTTSEIMEQAIDDALSFDFYGTLEYAKFLRNNMYMRLNPQVIMVRASMHPDRVEFNRLHPGYFADIQKSVMSRADEPATQLAYYLYTYGKNNNKDAKKNIPNTLKRSWNTRLSHASAYEINKYKNSEIGMINTIRICHATSPVINELMTTGSVSVEENELTWENMRSAGKSWTEILSTVKIGHMALLRNLKNIFTEIKNPVMAERIFKTLEAGVLSGKQFPFRYYAAYKKIQELSTTEIYFKSRILDCLEVCMDIACDNMPKLKGKTMCLSDNSGSAWGGVTSEYGTTVVAEIDNLSSVISARCSDEGYVGVFGDRLEVSAISQHNGVLIQTEKVSKLGKRIGMNTENGIWLFLENAIQNKEYWDNIIIYSDMQAGRGELYGLREEQIKYTKLGYNTKESHIDVAKLINVYRTTVNPKVNVMCVQTAGYDNISIPDFGYRTTLTSGWTGKEQIFLAENSKFWDSVDNLQTK